MPQISEIAERRMIMLFASLDEIIDFDPSEKERCDGCKDCRTVYCNGGFQFYGCYHKPYKGKWVKDIKRCPKEQPAEGGTT